MSLSYKNRNKLIIFFLLLNYIQSQYVKMEEAMEKPLRNYVSVCKQGLLYPVDKWKNLHIPKYL